MPASGEPPPFARLAGPSSGDRRSPPAPGPRSSPSARRAAAWLLTPRAPCPIGDAPSRRSAPGGGASAPRSSARKAVTSSS
eukprot:6273496-Alexandrium_andersonii.AAC.2